MKNIAMWQPVQVFAEDIQRIKSLIPGGILSLYSSLPTGETGYITESFSYSDTSGCIDYGLGGSIDEVMLPSANRALWDEWLDIHYWKGSMGEHEIVEQSQMPPCIARLVIKKIFARSDSTGVVVVQNWILSPPSGSRTLQEYRWMSSEGMR